MTAIKGTDFKKDFKNVCDRAYNGEAIIITRPHNENVVVVSEKHYSQMERVLAYALKIQSVLIEQNNGNKSKRTIGMQPSDFGGMSENLDSTLEGLEDLIK